MYSDVTTCNVGLYLVFVLTVTAC